MCRYGLDARSTTSYHQCDVDSFDCYAESTKLFDTFLRKLLPHANPTNLFGLRKIYTRFICVRGVAWGFENATFFHVSTVQENHGKPTRSRKSIISSCKKITRKSSREIASHFKIERFLSERSSYGDRL